MRSTRCECINLNPATNVMNPRAEAALSAGLGSRPSLGYAGREVRDGAGGDRGDRGDRSRSRLPRVRREVRRDPRRLGRARQPVRVHGDVPARRLDHRAAGDGRRPHHPSRARRRRALRARHPRVPDRRPAVHDRPRWSRRTRRARAAEVDHDGCQPQPAAAPGRRRSARSPTASVRRCCSTPRTRAGCSPAGCGRTLSTSAPI